jgi:hypothetical protein
MSKRTKNVGLVLLAGAGIGLALFAANKISNKD